MSFSTLEQSGIVGNSLMPGVPSCRSSDGEHEGLGKFFWRALQRCEVTQWDGPEEAPTDVSACDGGRRDQTSSLIHTEQELIK